MKMKSLAALGMAGLLMVSMTYSLSARADDAMENVAGLDEMNMLADASSSTQGGSMQGGSMQNDNSNMNSQGSNSSSSNTTTNNSDTSTGSSDQGTPDTATGDDDY